MGVSCIHVVVGNANAAGVCLTLQESLPEMACFGNNHLQKAGTNVPSDTNTYMNKHKATIGLKIVSPQTLVTQRGLMDWLIDKPWLVSHPSKWAPTPNILVPMSTKAKASKATTATQLGWYFTLPEECVAALTAVACS